MLKYRDGAPPPDTQEHYSRLRHDPAYRLACRLADIEDQLIPSLASLYPQPDQEGGQDDDET